MTIDVAAVLAWAERSFEPVVLLALLTTAMLGWSGYKGMWRFGPQVDLLVNAYRERLERAEERTKDWRDLAISGTGLAQRLADHVETRSPEGRPPA